MNLADYDQYKGKLFTTVCHALSYHGVSVRQVKKSTVYDRALSTTKLVANLLKSSNRNWTQDASDKQKSTPI